MHELRNFEDLPLLKARFFTYAIEARGSDLQLGDADRVLVGHGQRQLPRRLLQQPTSMVWEFLLEREDGLKLLEIEMRIVEALKVGDAFKAGTHNGARRLWHGVVDGDHALCQCGCNARRDQR